MLKGILDWLDHRTGYRTLLHYALDEPLPPGTGWAFTTGSMVAMLIGIQLATGVVLTMYYVPSPSLAYESVRYINDELALGWMLRGLHFWGASFIVVSAGVHLLRVFIYGGYKAPREVTWLTGVLLLLIVLGFSLSGYLLPWDQKAYWATTVTLNVARSSPVVGEYVASIMRGGVNLGALTLGRWYTAHVFLLPAALVTFILAHLVLMRRHGISGPLTPKSGKPIVFFPWHVMKDTIVMAAVFALLLAFVFTRPAHLDEVANPADSTYIPRPEWYFLSLFQMLKYFPGPLEPVGTMVIPGLAIGFLLALPFLDRKAGRHPFSAGRLPFTLVMALLAIGLVTLTTLGLRDLPARENGDVWGAKAIAGWQIVSAEDNNCARCHLEGGSASPLAVTRLARDEEWLLAHMIDPVALAPGVRGADDPPPAPVMNRTQAQAVVAYLNKLRAGAHPPDMDVASKLALSAIGTACVGCHKLDGEGGDTGPDLTHVGKRRDAEAIRRIVNDPVMEFGDTVMPAFGDKLTSAQMDALVAFLAARR
jgi:ubiquinol-cytochrome c reductase cytochrome b subunit